MTPAGVLAIVLAVVTGAAVLVGGWVLTGVVLVVCALLLVDLQGLLLRRNAGAVLPASALVALGVPLAVALDADGTIAGALVMAALLTTVGVALAGRRRRITRSLGATLLAGLLPGLGGSAVLLVAAVDPAGLLVLIGALLTGSAAGAALRRAGADPQVEAVAVLGVAALTALASILVTDLDWAAALSVGGLAFLGILGGAGLRGALPRVAGSPAGTVLAATGALALAAPVGLWLMR